MTPDRWQEIKQLVNAALQANSQARTALLQQSCADDFALRLGAEALLSQTRKLPSAPLAPNEWQRVEQVFQAALELDASQRAAFVSQACQNDERLKQEVQSLLVYQNAAGGLIHGAVIEAAGMLPSPDNANKARFTPGTTLNKRYRIIGLLGKGGMGEVYRADDLTLNQPVALKFLTERLSQDKAMLARFRSEVAMAHRVTHPNVCRVHDIGEVITSAGVLHFLSMEYVDGEDLSSLLRRIGRLPSDKAVEIAQQLCDGLAAAHEAGVLHRDLKPANVMIDGKGRVRITDFGLAGFAEQFTGSEIIAGTPAYMSPEQFAGKEVTTKSDIYALGLVLYEVFTGKRVFEAGSLDELRRMHESSAPTNPSSWVKNLDPLVERVILRCLEKEPSKRLASAKQVADALPGGDPLAAALAMGETPSPEMVAAAGLKTGMKPIYAVACLLTIIVGIIICTVLANRFWLLPKVMDNISPDMLEQKARAIIQQAGYIERPLDWARGLEFNYEYRRYVEEKVNVDKQWEQHTTAPLSALNFWYRQSPRELFPGSFYSRGQVTIADPVKMASGGSLLWMDATGRLLEFQAMPLEYDPTTAKSIPFDWQILFTAAGLDSTTFTTVEPQWMPENGFDERLAWTGNYKNLHLQIPIRIEAAAYRGRPVSFQIIWPWTKPLQDQQEYPMLGAFRLLTILLITLLLGTLWLARHNWLNGRGDRKGAFRLALFSFVALILRWVFAGSHTASIPELMLFFFVIVSQALLGASSAWLGYIALEPIVRRRWPAVIISWSRLLNGQLRDPLIGRDILVGVLCAVLMNIRFYLESYFELRFQTGTLNFGDQLLIENLAGAGNFVGGLIEIIGFSPMISMGTLLIVLLIRVLTRQQWLAISAYILLGVGLNILFVGRNPLMVGLLVGIVFAVNAFIMFRYGLLSFAAYSSIAYCFGMPMAANFNTWYSIYGLIGKGFVLMIAVFAFYTALGGQKVLTGKLLEE